MGSTEREEGEWKCYNNVTIRQYGVKAPRRSIADIHRFQWVRNGRSEYRGYVPGPGPSDVRNNKNTKFIRFDTMEKRQNGTVDGRTKNMQTAIDAWLVHICAFFRIWSFLFFFFLLIFVKRMMISRAAKIFFSLVVLLLFFLLFSSFVVSVTLLFIIIYFRKDFDVAWHFSFTTVPVTYNLHCSVV